MGETALLSPSSVVTFQSDKFPWENLEARRQCRLVSLLLPLKKNSFKAPSKAPFVDFASIKRLFRLSEFRKKSRRPLSLQLLFSPL